MSAGSNTSEETPVPFTVSTGNACAVLTLDDGAVLRVYPIALEVIRADKVNENGEPVYQVSASLAVRLERRETTT